ncbi:ATP-binding protein [Pseudomonas putida]|uniref:ATP-binding protein n=1 Tax=Pseudomonas putida TaxID=303 RepID=UPI0012603315|nr:ATP-binding protein [Pseudomonas putida]
MKKSNPEREFFRRRAGVARWLNELSRKDFSYTGRKKSGVSKGAGWEVIVAPAIISIYGFGKKNKHYDETVKFLEDIKKRFLKKDCFVDFSSTSSITAAALVVVYAALDEARIKRTGNAEVIWSKKNQRVNAILRANNIHKLIRGVKFSYALDSVKSMPVISSVGSEMMEEIIDFIQKRIYVDMSPTTEHIYGDAVSETINNVRLHAYPEASPADKKWWLMCSVVGKQLYLAIYDTGVGIPKTVVERPWFLRAVELTHPEKYSDLVAEYPEREKSWLLALVPTKISDEDLIYLSMQGDVSGTKEDKHGQGSKSILALVNDTEDGVLWVFSNSGLYKFNQSDKKPELYRLPKSFPGTLVQWNIELP